MINVKIYLPLKDNDGKCVIHAHTDFLEDIKDMPNLVEASKTSRLIEGFTITEAIGHWFDNDKHYIDKSKQYTS